MPASFFPPAPAESQDDSSSDKTQSDPASETGDGPTALAGCPAVAITPGYGRLKVTFGGDVMFATGTHALTDAAQKALSAVKKNVLDSHPKAQLVIEGHTDNVGGDSANMLLSERRAKAVADGLVAQGIVATRIEAKGYGEQFPKASNERAEGRKENRRVELVVIDDTRKKPEGIEGLSCKGSLACCQLKKTGKYKGASCLGQTQPLDAWGVDLSERKLSADGGALALAACTKTAAPAIWITSTNENRIAKLDERDGRELFRVATHGKFPHRTAVAQDKTVWVTNRKSGSYVHLSEEGEVLCSSPYKTCMTRAAAVDVDGYGWIGCYDKKLLIQVDPKETDGTTRVLGENGPVEVPRCKEVKRVPLKNASPYGLAANRQGMLFTCCGGNINMVDARAGTVVDVVRPISDRRVSCFAPYGMSIDRDGNPWYANYRCGNVIKLDGRTGQVLAVGAPPRFRKAEKELEKLEKKRLEKEVKKAADAAKKGAKQPDNLKVDAKPRDLSKVPDSELPSRYFERQPRLRAMGIDNRGHAWSPDNRGHHVYEFASDGRFIKRVDISSCGGKQSGPLGTGADSMGNMWTALQRRGLVVKYDTEGSILGCYDKKNRFKSPYTYSDFTGASMRMSASNIGRVVARMKQLKAVDWRLVTLRAVTPPGTGLCLRARSGCGETLEGVTWSPRKCVQAKKVSVKSWALDELKLPKAPVLEVELELSSSRSVASPIVYDLSAAATP